MALYAFTESSLCICTMAGVQAVADLAKAASDAAMWALVAAAAICVGGVFGSVELGADLALLGADQLFFKSKRRSSRCAAGLGGPAGGVPGVGGERARPALRSLISCPPLPCTCSSRSSSGRRRDERPERVSSYTNQAFGSRAPALPTKSGSGYALTAHALA